MGRFLAVLEMYRSRDVALDQPEAFAELRVRWAPGGDAGSATDEAERSSAGTAGLVEEDE